MEVEPPVPAPNSDKPVEPLNLVPPAAKKPKPTPDGSATPEPVTAAFEIFQEIPVDLKLVIFRLIPLIDLANADLVCKYWHSIVWVAQERLSLVDVHVHDLRPILRLIPRLTNIRSLVLDRATVSHPGLELSSLKNLCELELLDSNYSWRLSYQDSLPPSQFDHLLQLRSLKLDPSYIVDLDSISKLTNLTELEAHGHTSFPAVGATVAADYAHKLVQSVAKLSTLQRLKIEVIGPEIQENQVSMGLYDASQKYGQNVETGFILSSLRSLNSLRELNVTDCTTHFSLLWPWVQKLPLLEFLYADIEQVISPTLLGTLNASYSYNRRRQFIEQHSKSVVVEFLSTYALPVAGSGVVKRAPPFIVNAMIRCERSLRCTPLYLAMQADGCESLVEDLASLGAIRDRGCQDGNDTFTSPLFIGAFLSRYGSVKALLEKSVVVKFFHEKGSPAPEEIFIDRFSPEGHTALLTATMAGHIELCELLLNLGAHPNLRSIETGRTPLMSAASVRDDDSRTKLIQLFLKYRADVDAQSMKGTTALMKACDDGHSDAARLFIQAGAKVNIRRVDDGFSALHYACFNRHSSDIVQLLLESGAEVNLPSADGATALHVAVLNSGEQTVQLLLANPQVDINARTHLGETALFLSAHEGRHSIVELLLHQPSLDIDQSDETQLTPLAASCKMGKKSCALSLLQRGADTTLADKYGATPLFWATASGSYSLVNDLVGIAGTNINAATTTGTTALMMAAYKGLPNLVDCLTSCGASVNNSTVFGMTALHFAVEGGHSKVVEQLLDVGAPVDGAPEAKDLDVPTPLYLACQVNANNPAFLEMVKLLLMRGADPNRGCRLRCESGRGLLPATSAHPALNSEQSNWTPLHLACIQPDNDTVPLLLQHGANPNAVTSGNISPLMLCCQGLRLKTSRYRYPLQYDHHDTVVGKATAMLLLSAGAKVDTADTSGQTALTIAARTDQLGAIIPNLLIAGADPLAQAGKAAMSPLMVAIAANNQKALGAFTKHLNLKLPPSLPTAETYDALAGVAVDSSGMDLIRRATYHLPSYLDRISPPPILPIEPGVIDLW